VVARVDDSNSDDSNDHHDHCYRENRNQDQLLAHRNPNVPKHQDRNRYNWVSISGAHGPKSHTQLTEAVGNHISSAIGIESATVEFYCVLGCAVCLLGSAWNADTVVYYKFTNDMFNRLQITLVVVIGNTNNPGQEGDDKDTPPPNSLAFDLRAQPSKEQQKRQLDGPKTSVEENR
jgi:hypothetical protein